MTFSVPKTRRVHFRTVMEHTDYPCRFFSPAGFSRDDLEDTFAVLKPKGEFCDCEVLYNVAEFSRLKAQYWRGRAEGLQDAPRHLVK